MKKNNWKVTLIGETTKGERILAAGAKMSRIKGKTTDVFKDTAKAEDNKKVIEIVKKLGHTSFIEHLYLNFALDDVSVTIEQFMIEFRLTSFTIKSRRYVDFRNAGYYIPSIFLEENNKELLTKYTKHMDSLFEKYEELVDRGVHVEDARYILPYSYRSNILFSVNARELKHMLYSMIYGRGKKYEEVYNIGKKMYEQVLKKYPTVFNDLKESEIYKENKNETLSEVFTFGNSIQNREVKGLVELVNSTINNEETMILSSLISQGIYDENKFLEILQEENKKEQLFNILFNDLRKRDFEHVIFTFRLDNLSLANLTHFSRHRIHSPIIPHIGIAIEDNNYVIPKSIAEKVVLRNIYTEAYFENKKIYNEMLESGIPKESLVYFCLSGNTVNVMTTMNARELMTFIGLRTCERAQWEIRQFAIQMRQEAKKTFPIIFTKVGPNCFGTNKCPEGKMSCGDIKKENYFD